MDGIRGQAWFIDISSILLRISTHSRRFGISFRACQDRQQARGLLKDLALKIGDLKEVISSLGNIPTGKKKSELENQIVEISRQADSRAMR